MRQFIEDRLPGPYLAQSACKVIGESAVLAKASSLLFGATMVAIGIIGVATGGFAPIWGRVSKTLPDRQLLAYLCTFVSLACGIGLVAKRTARPAALALLIYLAAWTVLFKVPFIIRSPLVEVSYQSTGENLVLVAAAWVLYAEAAKGQNLLSGERGLWIAYVLYGLALIAFGLSHFVYLNLTAPLVPAWLPRPIFWAYFTGAIYLLTGGALVTGIARRAGALLAAIQIALITLLVWSPVIARGGAKPGDFEESVVSWTLMVAAWVIAASLKGRSWVRRDNFETPDERVAIEGA